MTTDQDLDVQVRGILRDALDREHGPDPLWIESPAAQRVAHQERRARQRWPLRLLAVAAVIGAVGAGALFAGTLAEPPEDAGAARNGWVALTVSDSSPSAAEDEDIWLVALGQEARRVIGTDTDSIRQICPAFSPDGRSLAYGRAEGAGRVYQESTLVVAEVADDGTVADRLTLDIGDGLPPPCPVWSPDGERLAFGVPLTSPINPEGSGEGSEVWVVRLADRAVTVLPDLLATDLEWSPDGSVLAVAGGLAVDSYALEDARIHLYETSTGMLRSLDDTIGVAHLTWSPDGRRIAYAGRGPQAASTTAYDSRGGLRLIDVQTGQQEVLADAYGVTHGLGPVWSPDGRAIVYQRCRQDPCEGESHQVVLVMPWERSDAGRPREVVIPSFQQTAQGSGTLLPYRVTWSPDSKYLLYVAWAWEWTNAGEDGPGGTIDPIVAAVPIDPKMSAVILSQATGLVAYDGYDMPRVSVYTWGRQPNLD